MGTGTGSATDSSGGGASLLEEASRALTKFRVYTTDDGGQTAKLVGDVLARSSEEALRIYFAKPAVDQDGDFAAVSENKFRWRHVTATVRTSFGDVSFTQTPTAAAVEVRDDEPQAALA